MAVQDAKPWDREHLRRQEPAVAEAEAEIRLVRLEQPHEAGLLGNEADVEMRRRAGHELAVTLSHVIRSAVRQPRREQRNGLVPDRPRNRIKPERRRQDLRQQDDPPRPLGAHRPIIKTSGSTRKHEYPNRYSANHSTE